MNELAALAAVLAALLLVLVLATGTATFLVYRRVRRSPLLQQGALALRARALPAGDARTIADWRRQLRQAVRGADAAVAVAAGRQHDPAQVARLATRLRWLADELDADLRLLAHERHPGRLRALLPEARSRVEAVQTAAARVRSAATWSAAAVRDQDLRVLTADLDEEVERVQAWAQAYRELCAGGS